MKRILLQILCGLCLTLGYGQTYTSGVFDVINDAAPGTVIISAQIDVDVTNNLVTVTIIGPDNSWLGLGFDAVSMDLDKDVIFFDGTNITDRQFVDVGVAPEVDAQEDWTITSNTTRSGERTLVVTRARDTGDAEDFIFPTTPPSSFNIVGAHGDNTFDAVYHGFFNKADEVISFNLLGVEETNTISFSLSPNPAKSNLNIIFPSNFKDSANVEVYSVLGKRIFSDSFDNVHTYSVNVANWNRGVYLVRISNENAVVTKRFVKQ